MSLINRVITYSTVFIHIITRKIRHQPDLIGLRILFIEQVEVGITKNEIQRKVQQRVINRFHKKDIVFYIRVMFQQLKLLQQRQHNPNSKQIYIPTK